MRRILAFIEIVLAMSLLIIASSQPLDKEDGLPGRRSPSGTRWYSTEIKD